MPPFIKTTVLLGASAILTAIVLASLLPGCTQNQENSPISINNSEGRLLLSVTCSADGAVAYATDGRNVYRYDRAATTEPWHCILSHTERLELAHRYDPREASPSPHPQ